MFDMFGIFGKKKSQEQPAVAPASEAHEEEFVIIERRGSANKVQETTIPYPFPAVYPNIRNQNQHDHQGTAAQGDVPEPLSLSSGIDGIPFILNPSLSNRTQRMDLSLVLQRIEAVQQTLAINYDFALERSILRESRAQ